MVLRAKQSFENQVRSQTEFGNEDEMNRAFSANNISVNMFLGRCPRLWMKTAPLALNTTLFGNADETSAGQVDCLKTWPICHGFDTYKTVSGKSAFS